MTGFKPEPSVLMSTTSSLTLLIPCNKVEYTYFVTRDHQPSNSWNSSEIPDIRNRFSQCIAISLWSIQSVVFAID